MTAISRRVFSICLAAAWLCSLVAAQSVNSSQTFQPSQASAVVPRLVNYYGKALDAEGKIISGTAGATFAIYSEQSGGAPLWMETQNITADAKGNYTVQLGATKPDGLPLDLFTSGEARWLGVRINSGEEQPRVLLLSVPYALKAADAETVGGLPASAFMLAMPASASASSSAAASTSTTVTPAVSGTGITDFLPLWTNTTGGLGNSVLFQSGSGTTAKVGINSTTPASTLDVNGAATVRGLLNLPPTGAATASAGKNSQPFSFSASSYNSGTGTAVNQNFRWQAEATSNNTASASGTLNLLHSVGANALTETGLKVAGNGQITFAAGQTFPGTGSGTVKSVGFSAPSSDFTVSGSPVTGSGTLGLAWNIAPTSADTANAIVKRDATGSFKATSISAVSNVSIPVTGNDQSSGGSSGVVGTSTNGYGVFGNSTNGDGVYGQSGSAIGVQGLGSTFGVYGTGVTGVAGFSNNGTYGVYGSSTGSGALGVFGLGFSGATGVYGSTNGSGYGVEGIVGSSGTDGVHGESSSENSGVAGLNNNSTSGYGVYGLAASAGIGGGFYNTSTGDALFAMNTNFGDTYAAFLDGNVEVDGNLSKAGGSFKIDDPLDPANKYLYHSFVESPDMKNVYDGVATLDAKGEALIQMPEWFGVLNRDFRYQLTCIGGFAPVYIAEELGNNQFKIGGGRAGMRVSWQITGIRQDPWANAHRIPVEQEKEAKLKGFYIHPELYGAPTEKQIEWARHPQMMKKLQEARKLTTQQPTPPAEPPVKQTPLRLPHSAALLPAKK